MIIAYVIFIMNIIILVQRYTQTLMWFIFHYYFYVFYDSAIFLQFIKF